MLRAEGLGKRYGDRWLFRNLNLDLSPGDRLVVLGRNGSGKSTLLRLLAGLAAPSEGRVGYPKGDLRTALGYSGLELALYANLTVAEHLHFTARMRGCEAREELLLGKVGLGHARHLPAAKLSSGMKARLKLALAIQADPSVLMLDEPGASLDEAGRDLVAQVCEEQAARGVLVLATNDPLERRLANFALDLDG